MKTALLRALPHLACIGLLCLTCTTDQPSQHAGGSTETVNCQVNGILYQPDGTTPAADVEVCVRLDSSLADTSGALTKTFARIACARTNDSGAYGFDSLATGDYAIQADDGQGNLALVMPVTVIDTSAHQSLGADTLKPAGAVKGTVLLAEGGDPRKVLVLAFGVDRLARVETDGTFRIENLAKGQYSLRFLPCLNDYGVYDSAGIQVTSADTTDLGTIRLPFLGIPSVKNLTITYDTLPQIISLTWQGATTPNVTGYNIYRKHADSAYVKLNAVPLTDTAYTDTTMLQGAGYQYAVTAVDSTGKEGAFAPSAPVTTFSLFIPVDTISMGDGTGPGQFGYLARVDVDTNGNLYVTDTKNGRLQKITPQGEVVFSLDTFEIPTAVAVGPDGNVYVTDQKKKLVFRLDTTGNLLGSWPTTGTPFGITADTAGVHVASDSGIEVFNAGGGVVDFMRYGGGTSQLKDVVANFSGGLLVTDDENVYTVDKTTRTFTMLYSIADKPNNQDPRLERLSDSTFLLKTFSTQQPQYSSLYILTAQGHVYTAWKTSRLISDVCAVPGGIVAVTNAGDIVFFIIAREL